jgi:hypothetical protein
VTELASQAGSQEISSLKIQGNLFKNFFIHVCNGSTDLGWLFAGIGS